nr:MAG TPA: hypothetical protein [Caudoviricetes sp.]
MNFVHCRARISNSSYFVCIKFFPNFLIFSY